MGFGPGTTLATSFELVVGSTVERFPIVPPRPAMNPSAMAAAVARHQVTKQTKTNNGASTAQTIFTAGSLTSHRQKIWKQCKVWWPTGGGGGGCIKKFECFALCGRRPQVWSPSKQLLVRSNRPQHLATDKGVILCAPLRSGYEGLFVKIRTRVRQTLP